MKVISGLPIVWVFDVVFELAAAFLGINVKTKIATALYDLLMTGNKEKREKLKVSQAALELARVEFNKENGTDLSLYEYNHMQNKTVFNKGWDKVKSFFSRTPSNSINPPAAGYGSSSSIRKSNSNTTGNGGNALGYGMYAQGDSRWANMPLGRLPNGRVATMATSGCGPTAMAAVANSLGASLGHGITPAQMGQFATQNGYISQGGANAGLFTLGAAQMGLSSTPLSSTRDLKSSLETGRPVILTGKSSDGNTANPFTSVGHIVMATGFNNGKTTILDPNSGKKRLYNVDKLGDSTEHAWSYSPMGYGVASDIAGGNGSSVGSKAFAQAITAANTEAAKKSRDKYNAKAGIAFTGSTTISSTPVNINVKGHWEQGLMNTSPIGALNKDGIDMENMNKAYQTFVNPSKGYQASGQDIVKYKSLDDKVYRTRNATYSYLRMILSTQFFNTVYHKNTFSTLRKEVPNGEKYIRKVLELALEYHNNKYNQKRVSLNEIQGLVAVLSAYVATWGFPRAAQLVYDGGRTFISSLANRVKAQNEQIALANKKGNALNDLKTKFENAANEKKSLQDELASQYSEGDANDIGNAIDSIAAAQSEYNGITQYSDFVALLANAKGFGKLKLLSQFVEAHVKSMMEGTDFFTAFNELQGIASPTTISDNLVGGNGTAYGNLSGVSKSLSDMINSPQNIHDEILGQTIRLAYNAESGNNYACVTPNDNGKFSVGAFQNRADNATTLLNNIRTQITDSNDRQILAKYANKTGGTLTAAEADELRTVLKKYPNQTKEVNDAYAMQWYHDWFFKKFGRWYDEGVIKDPRSMAYLGAIGTVGPAWVIGNKNSDRDFSDVWPGRASGVNKSEELNKIHSLIRSGGVAALSNDIYSNRLNNALATMQGYNMKHSVAVGEMSHALGYGEGDKTMSLTDFGSQFGKVAEVLATHFGDVTGLSVFNSLSNKASNASSAVSQLLGNIDSSDEAYAPASNYTSVTGSNRATNWFLQMPGSRVSSGFGPRTLNGKSQQHGGIDYAAPTGTPIYSPISGKVVLAKSTANENGYGNNIVILDKNGIGHRFGHMNKLIHKVGDIINVGDYVGPVGSTGYSTGPHLHYGVVQGPSYLESNAINPYNYSYPDGSFMVGNDSALGYGKIDNPYERERTRYHNSKHDYQGAGISTNDLRALGFGDGMKVDAGFDVSTTDGRLDRVISVLSDILTETKNTRAASSSDTKNMNVVNQNNTTINRTTNNQNTQTRTTMSKSPYMKRLTEVHNSLASRTAVRA